LLKAMLNSVFTRIWILGIPFALPLLLRAQVATPADFSRLLDQQRILAFCIGKDYAYIGQQADAALAKHEMDSCIAQFEENHRKLVASPLATGAVAKSLGKTLDIWSDFRWAATGEATPTNAPELLKRTNQLVLAMAATETEAESTNTARKMGYGNPMVDSLIHSSNQLGVLAQGMAMNYAFCAWKLPDDAVCATLPNHEQAFSEYLYQLLTNTSHDQQIEESISIISKNWKTLKGLFNSAGDVSLHEVFTLAATLSAQSGRITTIYAQSSH
jgi:hypothetical protein